MLRRLAIAVVIAAGLAFIGFHALEVWLEGQLPPVASVASYRATALRTTRVYAADGSVIAELWRERRTLASSAQIPRHVRLAAVAAEDGDFYDHPGLDLAGILRAMVVNVRTGRFSQGASTITQQVARTFHLTAEKTLRRKLLEVFLARKLERHLAKDEILELYLNQIYFGHGRWGLAEAARYYLGREVSALSVTDAALLMSLVPAPERLNPIDDPEGARRRRDRVLMRMADGGFITTGEAMAARRTPLPPTPRQQAAPPGTEWFVDAVRRRLEPALGRDRLLEDGLQVHTTLQPLAQAATAAAVRLHLGDAPEAPQAAVALMAPQSREVLALVGGRDPTESSFNRAVQANRQAGSTFKPFVVAAALERAVATTETTYPNEVTCYPGGRRRWCPRNSDGQHDGAPTTLHDALVRSLNVVVVRLLRDVGVAAVTDLARRVGVRSPIPADLTAALGSGTVTPLELLGAYATLADEGIAGRAVFVRRVEDADGRVVFGERADRHRALRPDIARTVTTMLTHAVDTGTGRNARIAGVRVAGKTGTTDDRIDAWFAGYTVPTDADRWPAVAGVVWVGHDRPASMPAASGGRTAAPIFADAVGGWLQRAWPSTASVLPSDR